MYRLFLLLLVSMCFQATAQDTVDATEADTGDTTVYISDDLIAFLHSGPSRNYRILGSVTAGTPVTYLQHSSDREFIEIVDDKQRTGWVEADNIMQSASFRSRLPQLEEQLQQSNAELETAQAELDTLNQHIHSLRSQVETQQSENTKLKQQLDIVSEQLNSQDQSEQREWFVMGGLIALGGMIIGIIITYLPKKKARQDGWMN